MDGRRSSQQNLVGDDPNIDLAKTLFKRRLEMGEKLRVFGSIFRVHKHAKIVFLEAGAVMRPDTAKRLRLECVSAKPIRQLLANLEMILLRDRAAVVRQRGQDYFVASERHHPGLAM